MALFQAALRGPRLFPPCVPLSLEHRVACIQAAEGQRRALGEAYYRPAQKQSTVLSHVALRSQSLSQRTRVEFQEQLPSLPLMALLQVVSTLLEFQSY